jgi:hypothetical protein
LRRISALASASVITPPTCKFRLSNQHNSGVKISSQ